MRRVFFRSRFICLGFFSYNNNNLIEMKNVLEDIFKILVV